MSHRETTATIGRFEAGESEHADVSELAELAREAFEQKRTKDCLDLTRAMLLVDPGNADALSMRGAIQSEMHRDLDNARAFIRHAQSKESPEPQLIPETEIEGRVHVETEVETSKSQLLTFASGILRTLLSSSFDSRRARGIRWLLVASGIIAIGVVLVAFPKFNTGKDAVQSSLLAMASPDVPKPAVSEEIRPTPIETAAVVLPARPAVAAKTAAPVPTPEPSPAALPDRPVVAGTGILAISSPGSVDIYENDAYLGSVPVSIELSAGEHTLEYRHGNLRKSATLVINRNETAKTTVTFDVTLPVNSRPWSEVFLDGVERKDLGQTPLGGVRVPIGGVLIFENPQFQAKRYRITGNETGIQVVFP